VTRVRPARRPPEVKVLVDQLAQAEMMGEGGWQEGAAHRPPTIVVEGHVEAVEAVR
jgi:hypothetical protein